MQEVGGGGSRRRRRAGRGHAREREKAEFVNVSGGSNPAHPDLSLYLQLRPSGEMSSMSLIFP